MWELTRKWETKKKIILKNQYSSRIKETGDRKKILYWSILEEKMCAFTRDIKMKNIGDTHMYHDDISMLTEKKTKCKRHTTIKEFILFLIIVFNLY